jgi:hypothetical protein
VGKIDGDECGGFAGGEVVDYLVRKTQQQSSDLAPRTLAALEEWLAMRVGAATEPIFFLVILNPLFPSLSSYNVSIIPIESRCNRAMTYLSYSD